MNHYNLGEYVEKFLDLKHKLMEHKLSEHEAALLASKLLELPPSMPSSLYFNIKQSHRFVPYLFVGTGLVIKKIEVRTREVAKLTMIISVKRGLQQMDISLPKNQALWFLTLLTLKYKDFQEDAIGGFEQEIDFEAQKLAKSLGIIFQTLSNDDYENLRRKLGDSREILQKSNRKTRLSVPPNHIAFTKDARATLDELTSNAITRFEEEYAGVITV
jgi:hypothetical protein